MGIPFGGEERVHRDGVQVLRNGIGRGGGREPKQRAVGGGEELVERSMDVGCWKRTPVALLIKPLLDLHIPFSPSPPPFSLYIFCSHTHTHTHTETAGLCFTGGGGGGDGGAMGGGKGEQEQ